MAPAPWRRAMAAPDAPAELLEAAEQGALAEQAPDAPAQAPVRRLDVVFRVWLPDFCMEMCYRGSVLYPNVDVERARVKKAQAVLIKKLSSRGDCHPRARCFLIAQDGRDLRPEEYIGAAQTVIGPTGPRIVLHAFVRGSTDRPFNAAGWQ